MTNCIIFGDLLQYNAIFFTNGRRINCKYMGSFYGKHHIFATFS